MTHSGAITKINQTPAGFPAAAVRHNVYRELISMLPIASVDQTRTFLTNLSIMKPMHEFPDDADEHRIDGEFLRFMNLRVTPEICEVGVKNRRIDKRLIEQILAAKFGEKLHAVPGFFFEESWRLNLPTGCAVWAYTGKSKFFAGILLQPLRTAKRFFLLSSASRGGPKAVNLTAPDRDLFERHHRESSGYQL